MKGMFPLKNHCFFIFILKFVVNAIFQPKIKNLHPDMFIAVLTLCCFKITGEGEGVRFIFDETASIFLEVPTFVSSLSHDSKFK